MTTLPMWLKHALTVVLMMAAITLAGLAHGARIADRGSPVRATSEAPR